MYKISRRQRDSMRKTQVRPGYRSIVFQAAVVVDPRIIEWIKCGSSSQAHAAITSVSCWTLPERGARARTIVGINLRARPLIDGGIDRIKLCYKMGILFIWKDLLQSGT